MKKYFVIGNPIDHSLSPELHNYWLNNNNIKARDKKRNEKRNNEERKRESNLSKAEESRKEKFSSAHLKVFV